IVHHSSFIVSTEGATAVRAPALAEAAAQLSWLSPGAAALAALARSPTALAWDAVRPDPGALLLAAREARAAQTLPFFFPALLHDPAVAEGALRHLGTRNHGTDSVHRSSFIV